MTTHKHAGLIVNGYRWAYFEKGVHAFQKAEGKGWSLIECSEEQLHNEDIEFMTENGLTLNQKMKKAVQKIYTKSLKTIHQ
jgi:hypothetical protein